ncbi:MAG: hypothetical protein KBA40_02085 [Candidatus Peribacteraceae bacterium]|nr:hypothetical protein [Candidatus Peribacteraceae bacterium]MBP9850460.1 hypothetical protein [Candidatus Peribacteraceae bacterium]
MKSSPDLPDHFLRAEIIGRHADRYAQITTQSYQPSDLRAFFSTSLTDLAKVIPENTWLKEYGDKIAEKEGPMRKSELDAIVLGMQDIVESSRAQLANVVPQFAESVPQDKGAWAEAM